MIGRQLRKEGDGARDLRVMALERRILAGARRSPRKVPSGQRQDGNKA